jgi:hypothetical protein
VGFCLSLLPCLPLNSSHELLAFLIGAAAARCASLQCGQFDEEFVAALKGRLYGCIAKGCVLPVLF